MIDSISQGPQKSSSLEFDNFKRLERSVEFTGDRLIITAILPIRGEQWNFEGILTRH